MNITSKLKEQKQNGISLTILFVLLILFGSLKTYKLYDTSGTSNLLIPLTFGIVNYLALAFTIYLLEKRGNSFASHLVFLAFIAGDYIYTFFNNSARLPLIYNLEIIFGMLTSIYLIFKLVAHSNEIKMYLVDVNRTVLFFLIFTLFRVYLNDTGGINVTSTYIIVFFLILFSAKEQDTIPLALTVFLSSLLRQVFIIVVYQLDASNTLSVIINILFNIYFIYYGLRIYRSLDERNNIYYN